MAITPAPIRPIFDMHALDMRAEFAALPSDLVRECELDLQGPAYGQVTTLFAYGDDFCIQQVIGGPAKYYVNSNHQDPENPVTMEEAAERLVRLLEYAEGDEDADEGDPNDPSTWPALKSNYTPPKRIYPYSAYVATVVEAVEWCKARKAEPVADWPKQYLFPREAPPEVDGNAKH